MPIYFSTHVYVFSQTDFPFSFPLSVNVVYFAMIHQFRDALDFAIILNFDFAALIDFEVPFGGAAVFCLMCQPYHKSVVHQSTHLLERDGLKSLQGILAVEETHEGDPGALGSLAFGHDQAQGTDLSPGERVWYCSVACRKEGTGVN